MNAITWVLLVAFVIVFLGTALVTLLGLAGTLPVPDKYLKMFAAGLLLEVVGALVWAFKSQDLGAKYQVWTVTGWVEFQDADVSPDSAYINPVPFKKVDPNGTFSVDVLEQAHGDAGMELPNLVIDRTDPNYKYAPAYIVLSEHYKPTFRFTKHPNHRITIDEAVKINKKPDERGNTAAQPKPVSSPPPPPSAAPSSSPVLSSPSPSPPVP